MVETANKKLVRQLAVVILIGVTLRLGMTRLGWRLPSLENRMMPAFVLWILFGLYWASAARNSAPTKSSESLVSTYFHQFMLGAALLLLILPLPGLTGWFLPWPIHFLAAAGAVVQAGFFGLAVWARRHLGRNWSAEVRIATDHQLVRTGPYRWLRHPIYTAMLGMSLGTAIASGQYHALLGLALLVVAYLRKTRLEDQILAETFGADYDAYRRHTWALVPLLF
jgi:protein-S-isoprenylcysteine O-methyltransferase Ste14